MLDERTTTARNQLTPIAGNNPFANPALMDSTRTFQERLGQDPMQFLERTENVLIRLMNNGGSEPVHIDSTRYFEVARNLEEKGFQIVSASGTVMGRSVQNTPGFRETATARNNPVDELERLTHAEIKAAGAHIYSLDGPASGSGQRVHFLRITGLPAQTQTENPLDTPLGVHDFRS